MRSSRQLATMGLAVLAIGCFCSRAITQERMRRAKFERKDALSTWEGEGGAVGAPVKPADTRAFATAATAG